MLARLILSLLLAAFALPATAAMPCHDGGAPVAMAGMTQAGQHHAPASAPLHGDAVIAGHSCIGCIPPSSLRIPPVATPLPVGRAAPVLIDHTLDPGRPIAPDPRPPRA